MTRKELEVKMRDIAQSLLEAVQELEEADDNLEVWEALDHISMDADLLFGFFQVLGQDSIEGYSGPDTI